MPDLQEIPPGTDPRTIRPWLNSLYRLCQKAGITVDPSSGLEGIKGPGGQTIRRVKGQQLTAKITYHGTTNQYSWIEVIPASGGAWTTGAYVGFAGTDPSRGSIPADAAFEANGNAAVPINFIVELTRDEAVGRMTFRAPACTL